MWRYVTPRLTGLAARNVRLAVLMIPVQIHRGSASCWLLLLRAAAGRAAGSCAAMHGAHRACRALWVQPLRLPALAALGCHARALCTSAESAESAAAAAARKAAFEAHEAKTGRVMSTVDRKDAADQAKLLFKKALAMVEASHGRRQMVFPKDILWLAGAPGAGKGALTP